MQVTAHCFTYGVKIDQHSVSFPFKDTILSVSYHKQDNKDGLMLQLSKEVTTSELSTEDEIQDDQGLFIEKRMRPYKEMLTEAAQLVEGLFSVFFLATPPKFDTDRIIVNVITESPEEEELVRLGRVTGGFGNINQPFQGSVYSITEKITSTVVQATEHLPALSFLAQGIRSQHQGDQEVAFFLYFRIIDGYFSDGVTHIENALLAKAQELSNYLTYNEETKNATKGILLILQLPSKSDTNFNGFISDITLIRHKLTHFSKTNAERHHRAGIKFDLNILNFHLRVACVRILLDEIGAK